MDVARTPVPQTIGRYQVVRTLGAGAMGEVYEVEDPELGRHVALKILSPAMAAYGPFRERFRREAVAMAQVRHPHVVQVYDLGTHQNLPFFTMELVDGGDCALLIERKIRLEVSELVRLAWQAAQGLGSAAARGLVHRDVKPANLLLHQNQVKVSDFGIARDVEQTGGLTQYGIVMGTPEYMAPEQAMGLPVDLRADIYGLGVTIFQMATGHLPFTGEAGSVLQAQVDRPMPNPQQFRSDLPEAFCKVLMRATNKDPNKRPQSYEELCADLAPLRDNMLEETLEGLPGSLVFADGPLTGRRIALPEGEFVVGRETDCQLVLDDPQASRRHAVFVRRSTSLEVKDLGSRNGVLVNSARVQSALLRVGDRVQVGSITFKVLPATTPRPPVSSSNKTAQAPTALSEARVNFLTRMTRVLADANPPQALLQALPGLLEGSPELLPVGRLVLMRWSVGQPGQVLLHEARSAADAVPPLTGALQAVCSSAQPLTLLDARADSRFATEAGKVALVMCVPLIHRGVVQGAFYVDSRETQPVSPTDTAFLEALANVTAAVLGAVTPGSPSPWS
jgi:serine/threonine-protein kinase